MLPDGLNWLCYFAGSSKGHQENSISFLFLKSPHQVDMKNVVKSSKHFWAFQYSRNSLCAHIQSSDEENLPGIEKKAIKIGN